MTPLIGWLLGACFVTAVAIGLDTLRRLRDERRAMLLLRVQVAMAEKQVGELIAAAAERQAGVPQMITVSMALARAIMGDLQPDPNCPCERCAARRAAEAKGKN